MQKIYQNWLALSLLFVTPVIFFSCGYQFMATQKAFKTLAVPVMENKSGESGISTVITNSFISEMMRFHGVTIVPPESADGVLKGVITNVIKRTVVRETSHKAEAREVVVTMDLTFKNKEGKTLYAVKDLSDSELYYVMPEKEMTRTAVFNAVEILAQRMAERAALSLGSDF